MNNQYITQSFEEYLEAHQYYSKELSALSLTDPTFSSILKEFFAPGTYFLYHNKISYVYIACALFFKIVLWEEHDFRVKHWMKTQSLTYNPPTIHKKTPHLYIKEPGISFSVVVLSSFDLEPTKNKVLHYWVPKVGVSFSKFDKIIGAK